MTVELIFKGDVSATLVDGSLLPVSGGTNVSVSTDSPTIKRNNITIISQGRETVVRINGVALSEMSSNTHQSIKDTVPANHIQTRDV